MQNLPYQLFLAVRFRQLLRFQCFAAQFVCGLRSRHEGVCLRSKTEIAVETVQGRFMGAAETVYPCYTKPTCGAFFIEIQRSFERLFGFVQTVEQA